MSVRSFKIILLISLLLAISVNIAIADELDQSQTQTGGYSRHICQLSIDSKSFKPSLNRLTKVDVLIWKAFDPNGDITVSITDNLGGNILTSASIHSSDIDPQGPQWMTADLPNITVTPELTYYIQLNSTFDCSEGDYAWMMSSWDNYDRGQNYGSSDGGLTWYYSITEDDEIVDYCFKTYGYINFPPEKPETPDGKISGKVSDEYYFSTSTMEPDGELVYFMWDWGDGNYSSWLGPYESDQIINVSNIWHYEGEYEIRVKAKDIFDIESEWSDPLVVSMPKSSVYPSISELNNITIEIKGGFGLTIIIHNNGNTTIQSIITIIIDSPFLFMGSETSTTRTIAEGASETMRTGTGIFGFGKVDVTVEIEDIIKSRIGYLFGPFVILSN